MIVRGVLARVVLYEPRSEEDEGAHHGYSTGKRNPGRGPRKSNPLSQEHARCTHRDMVRLKPQKTQEGNEEEKGGWGGKGLRIRTPRLL